LHEGLLDAITLKRAWQCLVDTAVAVAGVPTIAVQPYIIVLHASIQLVL
jgi:hypothetical protein